MDVIDIFTFAFPFYLYTLQWTCSAHSCVQCHIFYLTTELGYCLGFELKYGIDHAKCSEVDREDKSVGEDNISKNQK